MAEFVMRGLQFSLPDKMLTDKLREKLESGVYEGHEIFAVNKRVMPGDRVLELGTGIGYVAATCAGICGAENVTMVEANPEMIPIIKENLKRNGLYEFKILHGAVVPAGFGAESVSFFCTKPFWAGHLATEESNPRRVHEVPTIEFEGLLDRCRPNVVIMDIEGAEQHLFHQPWPDYVRHVMVELHPNMYPDTVIKRIVDCMSASDLIYDPGASKGFVIVFRRRQAE